MKFKITKYPYTLTDLRNGNRYFVQGNSFYLPKHLERTGMTLYEAQQAFPLKSTVRVFTGPTQDQGLLELRKMVGDAEFEVANHLMYPASNPTSEQPVMVSVIKMPERTMSYVMKPSYIEMSPNQAAACVCSLSDLMCRGCKCGQMGRERA